MSKQILRKIENEMIGHASRGEAIPFELKHRHLLVLMQEIEDPKKKADLMVQLGKLEEAEAKRQGHTDWTIDDVPPKVLALITGLEERNYRPYSPEQAH